MHCSMPAMQSLKFGCLPEEPEPIGNVALKLNPMPTESEEILLLPLKIVIFKFSRKRGIKILVPKGRHTVFENATTTAFDFLKQAVLRMASLPTRKTGVKLSPTFAFEDGDANSPAIDWQPNLVESMRVVGWVSFSE